MLAGASYSAWPSRSSACACWCRRSASRSARPPNYRGRPVFAGLGIVWLLWAGAAIIGGVAASQLGWRERAAPARSPAARARRVRARPRGRRVRLGGARLPRAPQGTRRGRLTTGGIKLLGISRSPRRRARPRARSRHGVGVAGIRGSRSRARGRCCDRADLQLREPHRPASRARAQGLLAARPRGVAVALLLVRHSTVAGTLVHHWSTRSPLRSSASARCSRCGATTLASRACWETRARTRWEPSRACSSWPACRSWGLLVYAVVILALNLASERSRSRGSSRATRYCWLDGSAGREVDDRPPGYRRVRHKPAPRVESARDIA